MRLLSVPDYSHHILPDFSNRLSAFITYSLILALIIFIIHSMFKPVNSKPEFPLMEEETTLYWKKNKIFEKSITSRPENKKWNFLDGPPFVTGMPHYGTLLSSIPKDLFGRYWTMKGYRVRRVWGWDGHGLPIENKVENKLHIKRKKDIEQVIGVKKFIEECFGYVQEVSGEWEWYVDHIARWVDFEHAYKTWDRRYMESVMWVFKQMYEKGHIYKGLRVSLYCPHCSTPISNFEVAMDQDNYKEITEPANTYKYQLADEKDTYFLAWSTTPWTKLVTPALAVNPKLTYVKVRQQDAYYILAKTTINMLNKEFPYEVISEIKGKDLVGRKFIPHYDFYKIDDTKKAFVVIPGDFITAEEGTGIVTIAAYGEEDLIVMNKENIQVAIHLDEEGHLKKEVPQWGGLYYLKANPLINEDLAKRGLLYDEHEITHKIPTCWRCHTRLYYAPQNAWYVNIQDFKPQLKKNNEIVNWFPPHFKYGRFLKSVEAAPDWCISRNRYWGSPVPVWECVCKERFVPGSIEELEKASGQKIADLHKPDIDEVTIVCKKCAKKAHRVPEVLDSWIEAGSAPFAERHFPFDERFKLEDFFPPDFVVEYTGQIRAWFYVLHVIATTICDTNAFKNVVVTGVILGTDGRKMSKNYGNYPDPKELLQKYGGDALRLYLLGSPVMHGEDIIISEEQYRGQVRGFLLILWNIYNFFVTYALVDGWKPQSQHIVGSSANILDQWILSLLQSVSEDVTNALDSYDTIVALERLRNFVADFSTWYIRRSRERIGPSAENVQDKDSFYVTCYFVLTTLCKILAPFSPFISEEIYRGLTHEESVHLTYWPKINEKLRNKKLEKEMILARQIVEAAHAKRKELQLKVRQPLASVTITAPTQLSEEVLQVIIDEINIKKVTIEHADKVTVKQINTVITQDLKEEGEAREIIRAIQEERKKLGTAMDEAVNVEIPSWPHKLEQYIKKKTLIKNITRGYTLLVQRI